jgi:ATP:corrinoid adenosyltransferase
MGKLQQGFVQIYTGNGKGKSTAVKHRFRKI